MKDVENWTIDQIAQALKEVERVEKNDGAILVIIARKFAKAVTMSR